MSSARLFLFRFSTAKQYDSPLTCGSKRREVSPSGKFSILMTSAPMSPSTMLQYGPGHDVGEVEDFDAFKGEWHTAFGFS